MAEPEFLEASLASFSTQRVKLKQKVQEFWKGERSLQKFLILDLHDWQENSINEVLDFIEVVLQDYQPLPDVPSLPDVPYGIGWVDIIQKGCRVVAAIVVAASSDWPQSRFRQSLEINQRLAQKGIGSFEFDDRDPWNEFRNKMRLDLTHLVGTIIDGGPGLQPPSGQNQPAAADFTAFSTLGFTDSDFQAVEQINSHLSLMLKELNQAPGKAANGSGSDQL